LEQAKEFDAAWRMKPGDVYDSTYLLKFLMLNNTLTRQGYKMNVAMKRDPAALRVDLTITFTKGGPVPPEY
jgi:hypothetical protein